MILQKKHHLHLSHVAISKLQENPLTKDPQPEVFEFSRTAEALWPGRDSALCANRTYRQPPFPTLSTSDDVRRSTIFSFSFWCASYFVAVPFTPWLSHLLLFPLLFILEAFLRNSCLWVESSLCRAPACTGCFVWRFFCVKAFVRKSFFVEKLSLCKRLFAQKRLCLTVCGVKGFLCKSCPV